MTIKMLIALMMITVTAVVQIPVVKATQMISELCKSR